MNLPNKLTVFRILLIPVFMLIVIFGGDASVKVAGTTVYWKLVIAAVVFAVASATDWFDGHIARSRNLVTNFGKFADPLADKMLTMTIHCTNLYYLLRLGLFPQLMGCF